MLTNTEPGEISPAHSVGHNVRVVLQPPLSRCGQGPPLILIRPSRYSHCQQHNASLDPEPVKKWAEESFAVAQVTFDASAESDAAEVGRLIRTTKDGLTAAKTCTGKGQYGLISELVMALIT